MNLDILTSTAYRPTRDAGRLLWSSKGDGSDGSTNVGTGDGTALAAEEAIIREHMQLDLALVS